MSLKNKQHRCHRTGRAGSVRFHSDEGDSIPLGRAGRPPCRRAIAYNGGMWIRVLVATSLGFLWASGLRADTIFLRDGSSHQGVIESRDESELKLRVNEDGVSATMVIPMSQIARIVITHNDPLPPPAAVATLPPSLAASSLPSNQGAGHPVPDPPSEVEIARFKSHGFFSEWASEMEGRGPDDIARLPDAERKLWDQATEADKAGKTVEVLDDLRSLEAAMETLPSGMVRLKSICQTQRSESFGVWMGRTHWQAISGKYTIGQFDLSDVRDIERPTLIGYLKEQTAPALEPLKTYFPPVDDKTGQPQAFKPAQLMGITASNALEVKDKALYAAAVLLAQLKLEPDMAAVDRGLLSTQLATVNRILARARELETAAKAAALKAQQDQRIADEKARRDAAAAREHMPPTTR